MTSLVKFLIAGTVLAGTSCGGYMVYKKVSSSSEEKVSSEQPAVSNQESGKVTTETQAPGTVQQ